MEKIRTLFHNMRCFERLFDEIRFAINVEIHFKIIISKLLFGKSLIGCKSKYFQLSRTCSEEIFGPQFHRFQFPFEGVDIMVSVTITE
jgi:hypothetical protein